MESLYPLAETNLILMKNNPITELVNELVQVYQEEGRYPFPYKDCKKVRDGNFALYDNFIPHLDLYFSDIAGYCSWGKKLAQWPDDKVGEAKARLEKSFFERYPHYRALESLITETNTPDLYKALQIYESMRELLLNILSQLH